MTTLKSWLIGGAPDCDIVVSLPTVSGRHCRLSRTIDGFVLEDLSSTNGTFVNGVRLQGATSVRPTDAITLGPVVPLPWPAVADSRVIRIGGEDDNDVVINDPVVSRYHARIVVEPGGMTIEDLGSTNGTFLGSRDRRITRSALLETDTVYFGSLERSARQLLNIPRNGSEGAGRTEAGPILEFRGGTLVVGRDPGCDRVIDQGTVSGRHARLTRGKSTSLIEDLGSANGTFVNGRRIDRVTEVSSGDRIGLGSLLLTLVENGQTTAKRAGRSANPGKTIRIFISSPMDVREEREYAARLIRRVADLHAATLSLEIMLWEAEPLLASDSFQAQIPAASDYDIFVCILWSRLGSPLKARKPDGTNYQSGTEFEFEQAMDAYRRDGKPAILVYKKTEEPDPVSRTDAKASMEAINQYNLVQQFFQTWFHHADGMSRGAYLQFKHAKEFEDLFKEHFSKLVAKKAQEMGLVLDQGAGSARVTWTDRSPFRGLETFEFEHEPIFFGRTRAISAALRALREKAAVDSPFLLVLAPSGSGKSSLVRAGLLPMLTRPGVIPGMVSWRRAIVRPSDAGGKLFDALATALLGPHAFPELARTSSVEAVARLLRDDAGRAFELLEPLWKRTAGSALVIVVDQMEELFSLKQVSHEDMKLYCKLLERFCRSGVWVIATLRSDFYHRFAEVPELVRLKSGRGQFDLQPLTPNEIADVIREPALAAGLRFERDARTGETLDDLLCSTASKSPESLPLLEFLLDELYNRRNPREDELTFQAYRELGGLEGALATRADEIFGRLTPDIKAQLPRIFRRLVSVGDGVGSPVTRKPASLDDLARDPRASVLINAFVQARLVITKSGTDGKPVVEIAHEALLTRWEPLRRWVATDRELLRVFNRVNADARLWNEAGRPSDRLIPAGQRLNEAKDLRTAGFDLSDVELQLIRISDFRAKVARQTKNWVLAGLTVALLITMGFGGYAWLSNNKARKSEEVASNSFQSSMKLIDEVRRIAQEDLRDVAGVQPIRQMIVETAWKKFDDLKLANQGNTGFLNALVRAQISQAIIVGEIGEFDKAVKLFNTAVEDQEQASRAQPADRETKLTLALALRERGNFYWQDDRSQEARPDAERSVKLLEELQGESNSPADQEPSQITCEYELAIAHNLMGQILRALGEIKAVDQFARSNVLFEDLKDRRIGMESISRMDCLLGIWSNENQLALIEAAKNTKPGYEQALIHHGHASDNVELALTVRESKDKDLTNSPTLVYSRSLGLRNQALTMIEQRRSSQSQGGRYIDHVPAIDDLFKKSIDGSSADSSDNKKGLTIAGSARLVLDNPNVSRYQWLHAQNLKLRADYHRAARVQADKVKEFQGQAREDYEKSKELLFQVTSTPKGNRPIYWTALLETQLELLKFYVVVPPNSSKFKDVNGQQMKVPIVDLRENRSSRDYKSTFNEVISTLNRLGKLTQEKTQQNRQLTIQIARAFFDIAIEYSEQKDQRNEAFKLFVSSSNLYANLISSDESRSGLELVKDFYRATERAIDCANGLNGQNSTVLALIKRALDVRSPGTDRQANALLVKLLNARGRLLELERKDGEAIAAYARSTEIAQAQLNASPWDYYLRKDTAEALHNLARLQGDKGENTAEIQTHRAWLRIWGVPYLSIDVGGMLDSNRPADIKELTALRRLTAENPSPVIFPVSANFNGENLPIKLELNDTAWPGEPLKDQAEWWRQERGGEIDNDLLKAFTTIREVAHQARVPFPKYCNDVVDKYTEDARINGTWTLKRFVFNGSDFTTNAMFDRLVIAGDSFKLFKGDQLFHEGKIKVEDARPNKRLTWSWKIAPRILADGVVPERVIDSEGLISLANDELTLCCDLGGRNRPTALESKNGSSHALIVWTRK